jgi:hypothetical protein
MSNYKVGYSKPPKQSQFKKGTSGNPNGRPRGSKNPATVINKVFWKPVKVTQDGKPTRIPIIELALTRLVTNAAKGDHKAMELTWKISTQCSEGTQSGSVTDLIAEGSPFDLTTEEMASISKNKLLKGVK